LSYLARDPIDVPEGVGRPVPGVEAKVVDEKEQMLPPGEVGELWIKSPATMDSYLNDPEGTAAVLTNGWLKTGDLAAILPQGYIQIVGRKRERILRGGYSVFPQEVEAALLSHPAIAEAVVIGAPSPDLGEEVVAFVVLKPGALATTHEISSYCKEHVAAYKYPREIIVLDQLPKGETDKILKSRLLGLVSPLSKRQTD
jgi:long-chain acyl-CoA synthetase